MLNAIGLANVGLDRFLAEKLPTARDLPCRLFGSVAGHCASEYTRVASAFDTAAEIAAVDADIARIMDDAVAKAKAGPRPVPGDVFDHVYARYR